MKHNGIIRQCLFGLFFIVMASTIHANGWLKEAPTAGFFINNTTKYLLAPAYDNGFYYATGLFDNYISLCGTDSCIKSGFTLSRYDDKGNIVWNKPFYPSAELLQHDSVYLCGPWSYRVLYRAYEPLYISNCKDSSGIIVKYALHETVWGYCGCIGLDCIPTSRYIEAYYAKFDYDGNVVWSGKTVSSDIFVLASNFAIPRLDYPERISLTNIKYENSKYSFNIQDILYDNNLDSFSTDMDSFPNIITIDTTVYHDQGLGLSPIKLIKTKDGGLLIYLVLGLNSTDTVSGAVTYSYQYYLLKLSAGNNKEWIYKITEEAMVAIGNLIEKDDRFYFGYEKGYNVGGYLTNFQQSQSNIFSIDKHGNNRTIKSFDNDIIYPHLRLLNQKIQMIGMGNGYTDGNNDNRVDYTVQFFQLNTDSSSIVKEVKMPTVSMASLTKIFTNETVIDLHNGSSVFGFRYEDVNNANNFKDVIVNIDSLGNVYTTKISGTIFGDKNNNCSVNSSDAFLRNYALRAINQTDSFYTSTDTLGKYEMYLDSGNYQLQLLPNPSYPLWKLQNCSLPTSIQLNDGDSATIDIGLTPTISCTNLTISLTAPFLRRCFENTYYINYCNNGTVNATNAYIDVALDHFLDFNSSAQAFTNLGNNVFRFHVGNVETGKCGAFSFNVTVNCDSTILGQTHCTEAHIFPDTVCSPTPYTGAIIQASATCKTNKVEFKLKNIGGNMQGDRKYIVIQDQVLRSIQNYNLPGGNELIVDVPLNNGSTYRIEAEQPANFPSYLGDPRVAAFVEGCRNNTSDTFTTGIISQFPLFDGEPYRAIDCQQNRGSYDPNDKVAKPTGVGAEHFIDKNIPLDYTIRFQNTGTDTAFTVSVTDTISPYLDINSIELEASSHKCNMIRIDSNVIQFLFKEIKLADSTTNLNASNGFVQFHIQQKQNNAIGTQINNFASIYFDYNPAILTNTVFHTIGENYLRVDLISTTKNEQYKNIELTVFPNPFAEKATLLIKNAELKNPILFLMDISGRLVDVVSNNRNEITIYRNKLSAGFYTYKLMDGNTEVATGKIIVQ